MHSSARILPLGPLNSANTFHNAQQKAIDCLLPAHLNVVVDLTEILQ